MIPCFQQAETPHGLGGTGRVCKGIDLCFPSHFEFFSFCCCSPAISRGSGSQAGSLGSGLAPWPCCQTPPLPHPLPHMFLLPVQVKVWSFPHSPAAPMDPFINAHPPELPVSSTLTAFLGKKSFETPGFTRQVTSLVALMPYGAT